MVPGRNRREGSADTLDVQNHKISEDERSRIRD